VYAGIKYTAGYANNLTTRPPLKTILNRRRLIGLTLHIMTDHKAILAILLSLCVSLGVALALGQGSMQVRGVPVVMLSWAIAFSIQWVVFIPSFYYKTEHYFDLTGSLTYLLVTAVALYLAEGLTYRDLLIAGVIFVWAVRLGSFLFIRIRKQGKDVRFDRIKQNFWRFLLTWTLQGLWVFLTLAMALAAITSEVKPQFDVLVWLGLAIWVFGFALEVAADRQKTGFRRDQRNAGQFITSGLWSWSRHPNYFGEMILWSGVAVMALPVLSGWQWVALISPVFVIFLLTKVSGIDMLEAQGLVRWGDDPNYHAYLARTSKLIPRRPLPIDGA
jgi:steroid 5-alpha reductase family enzyme